MHLFDRLSPRWAWRLARWPRRLLALALLLTAAVLAVGDPATSTTTAIPTTPVLVASHDLAPGALLDAADIDTVPWPRALLPAGVMSPGQEPIGRLLAGAVRTGEALTDVRFVGPGLSATLPAGQTAVPVRLADSGVTALLHPGDRIDLYAVATSMEGQPTPSSPVARAALVLAVPQQSDGIVPEGGIVVVAVTDATAAAVVQAAYTSSIAATLAPP